MADDETRDVEALAGEICPRGSGPCQKCVEGARETLASDWLAEHVARHVSEALERGWQEGFDAGENMAHLWGHVDHWEDEPENPYREGKGAGL